MPLEDHGSGGVGSTPMAVGHGATATGDDNPASRGDPEAQSGPSGGRVARGRRIRAAGAVVVVVVVGVAMVVAWRWSRPTADPVPAVADAPTDPVDLRWSLDLPSAAGVRVVVVPDPAGDDVLVWHVALHPSSDTVLARHDGVTGAVAWSVPVAPGEVVVPVLDGHPLGRPDDWPDPRVDVPTDTRAIDVADGTTAWVRRGAAGTTVTRLDDASLAVVDRRSCGAVDPATGRDRFRLGTA